MQNCRCVHLRSICGGRWFYISCWCYRISVCGQVRFVAWLRRWELMGRMWRDVDLFGLDSWIAVTSWFNYVPCTRQSWILKFTPINNSFFARKMYRTLKTFNVRWDSNKCNHVRLSTPSFLLSWISKRFPQPWHLQKWHTAIQCMTMHDGLEFHINFQAARNIYPGIECTEHQHMLPVEWH